MKVNELLNIKGKVAIVTGASSGLGVTFSEALAEEGANLVLAARRIEKLTEVAHNLEKLGIKAVRFQCDVTKKEEVHALIDVSVKNFGRVDIIVNNAGLAAMVPSTEMPVEEWNKVVSVNLTGVFSAPEPQLSR